MLDLMSEMIDTFDKVKYDEGDENMIHNEFSSIVYDELIIEIKTIWDSRTMNALHDFVWEDIKKSLAARGCGLRAAGRGPDREGW